jgi:hypothetical protein
MIPRDWGRVTPLLVLLVFHGLSGVLVRSEPDPDLPAPVTLESLLSNVSIPEISPRLELMSRIFNSDVRSEMPSESDLEDLVAYEWSKMGNATADGAFVVCTTGRRAGERLTIVVWTCCSWSWSPRQRFDRATQPCRLLPSSDLPGRVMPCSIPGFLQNWSSHDIPSTRPAPAGQINASHSG